MRGSALISRICVLGAVTGAAIACCFAPSAGAATWLPCDAAIDNIDCATYDLPLDRTGAVTGTTKVRAIRMSALEGPRMGTMFVIAGGPGQTSSVMLELMAQLFAGANRYDIIAVDQRGSGASEPLDCPRIENGTYSWDGGKPATDGVFTDCSNSLGAARGSYNTAEAVADLDDIRADLGIDNATFFGVSYGTKVALAYAKAHPNHTKALLLDSVLPTDQPSSFDTEGVAASRSALGGTLCGGSRCAKAGGSPVAGIAKLSKRLDRKPITTFMVSDAGKVSEAKIDADALYNIVFSADFNLFIYNQLPATVSAALRGNPAQLERLYLTATGAAGSSSTRAGAQRIARSLPKKSTRSITPKPGLTVSGRDTSMIGVFSYTMLFATSCADLSPPWVRSLDVSGRQASIDAAANAIPDSAFDPFSRTTVRDNSMASYCRGWQQSPNLPDIAQGPLPDIPTLALDGTLDLRTPVSWAQQAVAGDPSAQVVKIPNAGHSVIGTDVSGCALSLAQRFLVYGATDGKCRSSSPAVPIARRASTSLGGVTALPGKCKGVSGAACVKARKRLTAGYEGLRDALDQLMIGGMDVGSGIYSGAWLVDYGIDDNLNLVANDIALTGMSSVPGTAISGTVALTDLPRIDDRVRISGFRRASIGGSVAFDRASDSLSISGRTKKGLVTVYVRPSKRPASAATSKRLALRRTWALVTTPPQGRIVP
ncbi:MAG: alpha/beta hydrolase [Solirubrobacterales bacterium]